MCVVSLIMDAKASEWQKYFQDIQIQGVGVTVPWPVISPSIPLPTKAEIDEFRRLLERAREYDRKNNEPDCELESKRQLLRDMAKALGIGELNFV